MDPYLERFVNQWLEKADRYSGDELFSVFDKFFTLYVVFNKLYAAAYHFSNSQMASQGKVRKLYGDRRAATAGVVQFLTPDTMNARFISNKEAQNAIQELSAIIRLQEFHFSLDAASGMWKSEQDVKLADDLNSNDVDKRINAIVTILYHVRCNLFHGRKQFVEEQKRILRPSNVLLRELIILLRDKL